VYPQDIRILFVWVGSSFQIVFTSSIFWFYLVLLATSCIAFATVDYTDAVQGAMVPAMFGNAVMSLSVFMLTFFIGQCFSDAKARFENVCKTNGCVTRLSALAGGSLSPKAAYVLMRYTNAIMHIYYLMLSGPLDDGKWALLQKRGLLMDDEIKALRLQGSPAVVLYSWALSFLRSISQRGESGSLTERIFCELIQPMEAQIGGARGLAAKQIAYTITQIPSVYFHVVYFATNVFMTCTCYDAGYAVAGALNGPCVAGSEETKCVSRVIMIISTELLLLVLFQSLLLTAQSLADIYGDKPCQYDLGNDLDNLWKESQNVIQSMSVECPVLKGNIGTVSEDIERGLLPS
jgi:hypothetical protein